MQGSARKGFHKGNPGTYDASMAGKPRFISIKTIKGWLVKLQPNVSSTGTRQGRYLAEAEAHGFVEQLKFVQCQVAEPEVYKTSELTKMLATATGIGNGSPTLPWSMVPRNFAVWKCAEK